MNIALIAHDSKKQEMIEFVKKHESFFKQHSLFATGTTGLKIMENTDLKVITLEVVQRNEAAIKLYEKFGFEIVGNLRKRLKVDGCYFDSFVMEKVLD